MGKDTQARLGMSREKSRKTKKSAGRPRANMSPKSPMAERLQRVFRGLRFEDVGEIMGVTGESAGQYLKGLVEPKASSLARIREATGCDLNWLLTGEESSVAAEAPGGYADGCPHPLPMVGRVAADDSGGSLVEFDHEAEPLLLGRQVGCLEVHGDSLAPLARDGQHILVDLSDRTVRDGDIAAVETRGGDTYVKRWYRHDGEIVLTSLNPVEPQAPVRLKEKQIRQVFVLVGVWFE